jgi:uncharacterized protein (TIGR03545 family)
MAKKAPKAEKPPKEPKLKKVPGPLRKPIKQKKFEKKFLKYIEHPGDKKFFMDCFTLTDGMYTIKQQTADAKIVKKLKGLLKVIKKNRKGSVKIIPIILAAIVVGGIIVFVTVFMNPLLEKVIEGGLETVFEAKSDVYGFHLGILNMQVKIDSLTIANRDSPMKNIIEMGRTEFRMNPRALLFGKINIEEISAASLQFGTNRTVSGALPNREIPPPPPPKPKVDAPPLIDFENFDAEALLEREFDKLSTPKAYEIAAQAYNDAVAKWQAQIEQTKDRVQELEDKAAPVLAININNMNNAETITAAIRDITDLVNSVKGAVDDASGLVDAVEEDVNTAKNLEQTARNSITNDINHLKSYVDLQGGAAFEALEPSIREILSGQAEQYISYGMIGLNALEKLKNISAQLPQSEKEDEAEQPDFKGRTVYFPTKQYPRFYIGLMTSDFTLNDWNWGIEIKGISSDPDISDEATSLEFTAMETNANPIAINTLASADFRTASPDLFGVQVAGSGFAFSIGDYLAEAGIGGFAGLANFDMTFNGAKSGDISGGGDVAITQSEIIDPEGTLATAIDEALQSIDAINLGIDYEFIKDGDDQFTLDTNLADLVATIVRRTAEQYMQQALEKIEQVVRDYVAANLEGTLAEKVDLDEILAIARGDEAALDRMNNLLDEKKAEFEQKLRGAAEEAVDKAVEEAKDQARDAIRDNLQNVLPFGRR